MGMFVPTKLSKCDATKEKCENMGFVIVYNKHFISFMM